jgi:hypothetical protein
MVQQRKHCVTLQYANIAFKQQWVDQHVGLFSEPVGIPGTSLSYSVILIRMCARARPWFPGYFGYNFDPYYLLVDLLHLSEQISLTSDIDESTIMIVGLTVNFFISVLRL